MPKMHYTSVSVRPVPFTACGLGAELTIAAPMKKIAKLSTARAAFRFVSNHLPLYRYSQSTGGSPSASTLASLFINRHQDSPTCKP